MCRRRSLRRLELFNTWLWHDELPLLALPLLTHLACGLAPLDPPEVAVPVGSSSIRSLRFSCAEQGLRLSALRFPAGSVEITELRGFTATTAKDMADLPKLRQLCELSLAQLDFSVNDAVFKDVMLQLTLLRSLELLGLEAVTDDGVGALAALSQLVVLHLDNAPHVGDAGLSAALSAMPKMRSLRLRCVAWLTYVFVDSVFETHAELSCYVGYSEVEMKIVSAEECRLALQQQMQPERGGEHLIVWFSVA